MFRTAAAATALLVLTAAPALAFERQSFDAKALAIDGVLGTLEVTVDPNATQVTVDVDGAQRWLDEVRVRQSGERVELVQKDRPRRINDRDREDWLAVTVTVPTGTALTISDYIGEGKVGDLSGPLTLDDIQSGELEIGQVTTLDLGISGSGDITVAGAETADVGINGSGDVKLGPVTRDLTVRISGSGDVQAQRTAGKTDLSINGSGDITVAEVDGPVSVAISGSGDVRLRSGTADPFAVSISGSGDVEMGGTARNQTINQSGSGSVRVSNAAR